MYHVGAKDEDPGKTGFAHFFEHFFLKEQKILKEVNGMILFHSNGGSNNANTSPDRTYYYEVFPSNKLELALWIESERMLHPKLIKLVLILKMKL